MKTEASIKLSEDVVKAIDERVANTQDRSEFIEAVLWTFLRQTIRQEQEQRDFEILNRHAEELNEEAADVLEYQVSW